MGTYFNPGKSGFERIRKEEYVDKTGLISLLNGTLDSTRGLTCISRPRRFGKSYVTQMLCAYYDRSCDAEELFRDLAIANDPSFHEHLNRYIVISLDLTSFVSMAKRDGLAMRDIPRLIEARLLSELREEYPELGSGVSLSGGLIQLVEREKCKIVFIIDEWDAVIREAPDDQEAQKNYLYMLRSWFKNANFTSKVVAAAYMTGILPIKKDGSQSAISDFNEFTMIKPRMFGEYVGFTEPEVAALCEKHGVDFARMKQWYDGYYFQGVGSVYNPNSVMKAIQYRDFDSYWVETSAAESLMDYIRRDFKGLSRTIAELIGGVDVRVSTLGFANDLKTFRGKDDVLTLLIHLGYLAYNSENETVHIPNEEIRREFSRAIRNVENGETVRRLQESDRLFEDTIHMNEDAVAAQIEKVHTEETSPLHYNREESLRSVIKLAYYTYRDYYLQWEELPTGDGYADVVYIPRRNSEWPALVIELKWNQNAESAIDQIMKKQYPEGLRNLDCEILLVGISYNKSAPAGERKHQCKIIRLARE